MTTWNILTDYPDVPYPAEFSRTQLTNSAVMRSPLTGAVQSAERAGARWLVRCEWVVTGEDRNRVEAMLARLNGQEHRLRLPMYKSQRYGVWTGSPVVDGGSQPLGYAVNIRGATASVTDYARAGDFIRITGGSNCIHMITDDADTDGAGLATLSIWPPLRASPPDASVIFPALNITGVYILQSVGEIQTRDILASGDLYSRIEAVFEDDVLA